MTDHANLWEAVTAARKEFAPVTKSRTAKVQTKAGGSYSYDYADLSDVLDATIPALIEHGVFVYQCPTVIGDGVVMVSKLVHVSGQEVQDIYPLTSTGTMQERGSEISYVRRYMLMSQLGIAAEDDDGGSAPERQRTQTQPTQRNGNGADPDKDHRGGLLAEINKTFAAEVRDDARHWLIRAYTGKTTPDNVRESSNDLTPDECKMLADAIRKNRKEYQRLWMEHAAAA